jgi:rubrerythrin
LQPEQQEQAQPPAAARLLCTVCMDAPLEGTFIPCGHVVACRDCGDLVMQTPGGARCPICRATCDRFLRIYIHGA